MGDLERLLLEAVVFLVLGYLGVRKGRGIIIMAKDSLDALTKRIDLLAESQRAQAEALQDLSRNHGLAIERLRKDLRVLPCYKEGVAHGS
jgi:hypothetical protein